MKILFYGRLADAIAPEIDLDLGEDCTVGGIRERLVREHPLAAETLMNVRARAVVGGSLAPDHQPVARDDTVEFLAPVSGG
jgi:molybdopterin converting factor small subunit